MMNRFVEVILPLPLKGTFTYLTDHKIEIGQRVVVQFGVRKIYSAIVVKLHNNKPTKYSVKKIEAVIDELPIVNKLQLKFWNWISEYYMCNIGDVMNVALPSSLKLASQTNIEINSNFKGDISSLKNNEMIILDFINEKTKININQLIKETNISNIFSVLNDLINKEVITVREDLHDKFSIKKERFLSYVGTEKMLKKTFLTQKQLKFINDFFKINETHKDKKWIVSNLLKKKNFSRSILNTLVKKKFFQIKEKEVSRILENENVINHKDIELTVLQKQALEKINQSFKEKNVCLLHGVTSSGKTEIYIHLIRQQLNLGKQVLYLLPEIALTSQMISRLKQNFGKYVVVTHSKKNISERVEVWRELQKNKLNIVLGTRSSLFFPFNNLGLIIVDEEHDSSFKQQQPNPKYHARDASIYLASLHKSKVLLGSATPSLESYYNAKIGKYGHVELLERYKGVKMPKIDVIDILKAKRKKSMDDMFSLHLLDSINTCLSNGKQVILFQNRRGYSSILSCNNCGFVHTCIHCDVSLTYHKENHNLKCHYCGYEQIKIDKCSKCNSNLLEEKGFGTEQVEEKLKKIFCDISVGRIDYDTTKNKNQLKKIISSFENGDIKILVGTQMIAKGFDFDNVGLVAVLNADSILQFPDFRAYERAFSLMMQVSGRAGRRDDLGKVCIQTFNKNDDIFGFLIKNDFKKFINIEIEQRRKFLYPPFVRLIKITLKHKNVNNLDLFSEHFSSLLRKSFGNRVLGPVYPLVSKIRNYYHKDILLKIENKSSFKNAKDILDIIIEQIKTNYSKSQTIISVDVDPN